MLPSPNKVNQYFVTSLNGIFLLYLPASKSPNSFVMNREHLLFSFILLLLSPAVTAQTSYRVIGAVHHIEKAVTSDFFINKLEDRRAFRANLGIVNRGKDHSEKRALIPEVGFWEEIKLRMNSWTAPAPQSSPVTVQVEELYLWENRSRQSGEGHVQLRVRFLENGRSTPVEVEILGKEMLVSEGHGPRIEKAFFQCLQRYSELRQAEEQPTADLAAANFPSGGWGSAASFLDLWNGDLKPANIRLKKIGRAEVPRFKIRSGRSHSYYAIAKGDNWLIKANTYFGEGDYYVPILEKGRYLFLIDERPREGWQHLSFERGKQGERVGVIIDMETGVPQMADDELLQRLMAPYPDLQDRYLFKEIKKYPFQLNRVRNVIAEINRREENS